MIAKVLFIDLMKNPTLHERSKHINVKYHFIREVIEQGTIKVKKIPTEDNPVDVLTKVLPVTKFKNCLNLVGARSC